MVRNPRRRARVRSAASVARAEAMLCPRIEMLEEQLVLGPRVDEGGDEREHRGGGEHHQQHEATRRAAGTSSWGHRVPEEDGGLHHRADHPIGGR